MPWRVLNRNYLCLAGLACVLCFAAFRSGGMRTSDRTLCAIAISICASLFWITGRATSSLLSRWLVCALFLLPISAGLQLVPLPAGLVKVISPARAELSDNLSIVGAPQAFETLSALPSATFAELIRLLSFALVFLCIREISLRIGRKAWIVASPLLVCATLEALLGVVQSVNRTPTSSVSGTFVNRNHFSAILEVALPLVAAFVVNQWRRFRTKQNQTIRMTLQIAGLGALTVLILVAILESLSRGGFLIAIFSLIVLLVVETFHEFPTGKHAWAALSMGLAVLAVVALLAPMELVTRLGAKPQGVEPTYDQRMVFWSDTVRVIRDYPVFGCGWGAFVSVFQKYNSSTIPLEVDHAHNDYLEVWAEGGVVALLAVGILVVTTLRELSRALRFRSPDSRSALAIGCCGSLAAILAHALVDFAFYIPAIAMSMAWIGGLASGMGAPARDQRMEDVLGVPLTLPARPERSLPWSRYRRV